MMYTAQTIITNRFASHTLYLDTVVLIADCMGLQAVRGEDLTRVNGTCDTSVEEIARLEVALEDLGRNYVSAFRVYYSYNGTDGVEIYGKPEKSCLLQQIHFVTEAKKQLLFARNDPAVARMIVALDSIIHQKTREFARSPF